ncbi:unnamed protein product, partial [marine sediment metagenome]
MTILKKTVSLNPGESKAAGFTFTPSVAKVHSVLVNGLSGSFNAVEAAKGFITLYMTGTPTQEWQVGWYYPDEDTFRYHRRDYQGVPDTSWRASYDPCTSPPEYPIDLNNLIVKITTYSEAHICPHTGYKGNCRWGEFGPFTVEDGGVYTIDVTTGILS